MYVSSLIFKISNPDYF